MLTGTGFGDHPGLAHVASEHHLTNGVVDLVGAGVGEVLALEVDRAPDPLRKPLGRIERSWPADEVPMQGRELEALLRDYVGRPTPLYLAHGLSELVGGRVYLKREDLLHTGAHKINNAIGQALLAKRMGKRRVIAETGAGQHGVAAATACALLGLECVVYMGTEDMRRQRPNVERM